MSADRVSGFSLIELLVTIAIVGILAAIAYPAYRQYVLTAHRTDAQRVLTLNAQILQRCYTQTFTFVGCTGLSTSSANGYYTVDNSGVAAQTFTLKATATGSQTADTSCETFTIDQTGKEKAMDSGNADTSTTCWGGS